VTGHAALQRAQENDEKLSRRLSSRPKSPHHHNDGLSSFSLRVCRATVLETTYDLVECLGRLWCGGRKYVYPPFSASVAVFIVSRSNRGCRREVRCR
jgi:hypothetical protein